MEWRDIGEQREHRRYPRHARRQDRTQPPHERNAGGHRAGDLQVLVHRLRPRPRQGQRRAARIHCHRLGLTPRPPRPLPRPQRRDSELGEIPEGWEIRTSRRSVIDRLSVGKKYEQKTVKPIGKVPVLDKGKSGIIGYHDDEARRGCIERIVPSPCSQTTPATCVLSIFHSQQYRTCCHLLVKGVDTIWAFYATFGKQSFIEYKGHWPDFVIHKIVVPDIEADHLEFCKCKPIRLLRMAWAYESETAHAR